jgi:putative hydrolase of the HAD superfamily
MTIKNVVFDVGNVLVRWDPHFIVTNAFPEYDNPADLVQKIFKNKTWYNLNLGLISEDEALAQYHQHLGIGIDRLQHMVDVARASLELFPRSVELMKQLESAQFSLFALTDNTHEIIAYLQNKYDFWPMFQGIVVSAQVGHLKPSPEIYQHLLTSYGLKAEETVFIDDHLPNVEGAKAMGIAAIQFQNIEQCIEMLRALDMQF